MPAVERSEISQDQLNSAEQSPGRELNLLDIFESAGLLNRDRAAERPSTRAYQGLDDEGKDEARGRERRESRHWRD